jgi:hypothetical protein
MSTHLSSLEFPWMTEFGKTVDEARATGTAVILCGDGTSGKRCALEALARRVQDDDEATVVTVRLQAESDAIKHLHTLVDEITPWSIPRDWRRNNMNRMVRTLVRRLCQQNVGLLMLRNCHVLDHMAYGVIFDVLSDLRGVGQKCGLVLAGRGQVQNFVHDTRAHLGSIRQYARIPQMTVGDVMAALNAWCRADKLSTKAERGDVQAQDVIAKIHEGIGGNIGRLAGFAEVKNRRFAKRDFSEELVDDIFLSLRHPDPES